MKKIIEVRYEIGEEVFLVADSEQRKRIVVAITINPGTLIYTLSAGDFETAHYDFEIAKDKNVVY